jgi:MSHA biogenesis protein MshG
MPAFRYRGRSARGELVTGQLEADTADAIAGRLFGLGITPIEIERAEGTAAVDALWRRFGGGKPKRTDLLLFARQMYSITKSGLPLLRGLRGLAHSTQNTVLREALNDVLQSLESGRDLTGSLARHGELFSPLFLSIVRVGESTGTLDLAFLRLTEYLAQDQDLQDRVRGAMRYPLIVVCAIGIALAIITNFVIPNFAPIFRILGDAIPWPTRVILAVSTFSRDHGVFLLAVIATLAVAFSRWVRTEAGRYRWDRARLRFPGVGVLLHEAVLSRMSRSLSISLEAGLPMIQALGLIARSAGNEYLAERMLRVRDAVERGEALSRACHLAGVFPPLVVQMMEVGEETGELTRLLDEVASFYQREVEHRLKNLSAVIEPLLIIGVGGMVLVLALGVFLPMWDMIAKVGHVH